MDDAQEVPVDDEKEEPELVGFYDRMTEEQRAALHKAREETRQALFAGKGVDPADEKGNPDLDVPASEWLRNYSVFDIEATRRMMGILPKEQQTVHVAVLHPGYDSNDPAKLLGVYSQRFRGEARCYRELKALGYDQPTDVIEFVIDKDYDLDAADSAEALALWNSVPMPPTKGVENDRKEADQA